jgi:hypothetical protein
MAKKNTLLYIGGAAALLFLFKDKLFAKGSADVAATLDEAPDQSTEKIDATVEAPAGTSTSTAVQQALALVSNVKDAVVQIKTAGGKKIKVRKGKKKKCTLTKEQLTTYCFEKTGKKKGAEFRRCYREARRKCAITIIPPTETIKP